jgi:hypothetical protein
LYLVLGTRTTSPLEFLSCSKYLLRIALAFYLASVISSGSVATSSAVSYALLSAAMVGSGLVTSGVVVTSTGSGVISSLSITSSSCFFPEYKSSSSCTKVSS